MIKLTPQKINEYLLLAYETSKKAYAPYSHFHVGVVLLTKNNKIYRGFNLENIVLPLGMCAEKSAFANAFNDDAKEFRAIFISSINASSPISPCGGCRQFMNEFVDGDFDVYFSSKNLEIKHYTLSQLLPEKPFSNNKFQ